ncbi:putative pantothenate kinase [Helianthus annuus]|nr:putative pantothenate kinase [Helianthus annuus]KAJ0686662.1 putative pantothenate kinase [Helianthus annuus]KAJ0690475.1 putative pantothenate kinase [Helianthus annuus]KAJ0872029.1 putative pantothenate kinase [Helianthus annuus]
MGHTETCSSTIETIFSPILDAIDTEPNIYDYGGKQWRESDLVLPSCGDDDVNDTLRMSCEYSDLFIPDMIVSSSRLLDYEYDESSRFFGDECLLLPFLEDNIQTENRYVDGSVYSEPVMVSEDSNLYAVASERGTDDARRRGVAFAGAFSAHLARENEASLAVLPDLLMELDSMSEETRLLTLIEGVLVANIFYWGSRACVDLYHKGTLIEIYRMSRKKMQRPWRASTIKY